MTVTVGDAVFWLRSDDSRMRADLQSSEGHVRGWAGKVGGFLSNAMSFAVGGMIQQGIGSIVDGVKNLASEALGAVSNNEQLELSLKNLAAREIKNTSNGTVSMADALAQAVPRAKELSDWMQKLAIKSPFTKEGVAQAFKGVMAYGFASKEAQRMTQAMVDWSAGAGAGEDAMGRVALALGQIKAKGKLAGQEVLQLVNAGVDVRGILAKAFNVTTAELEDMQQKGLIPADKAIEAIIKSMEEDFGGAAARSTTTWGGLLSTLSDIKEVSLRNVFGSIFEKAQPYVASIVDKLSGQGFQDALKNFGSFLGEQVGVGLDKLQSVYEYLDQNVLPRIVNFATDAQASFNEGGLQGLANFLVDKFKTVVWPTIWTEIFTWSNKFWEWLTGPGGALDSAAGQLDRLAQAILVWALDPKTQAQLQMTGAMITDAILAPVGTPSDVQGMDTVGKFATALTKLFASMSTAFVSIGMNITEGMIDGIIAKMADKKTQDELVNAFNLAFKNINDRINPLHLLIDAAGSVIKSYDKGGIVPGPLGAPQLAIVHGGEQVVPVDQTVNYWQPTFNYGNAPVNSALDVQLMRFAAGA